jgi:hypothetical protein
MPQAGVGFSGKMSLDAAQNSACRGVKERNGALR